jgi:hypothetical protein
MEKPSGRFIDMRSEPDPATRPPTTNPHSKIKNLFLFAPSSAENQGRPRRDRPYPRLATQPRKRDNGKRRGFRIILLIRGNQRMHSGH